MKRPFIVLLLFFTSLGFCQNAVLEPGIYKANVQGQGLMLKVLEGNKYEMAVFFGKYTVENDTVIFRNKEGNESAFRVKVNKDAEFSSTLKINFKSEGSMYYAGRMYIGTQKDDNSVVEYKSVSEYLDKKPNAFNNRNREVKIDVDKTKYLYFVDNPRRATATVSKFQIDPDASEIEVEYNGSDFKNVELKGTIDPVTKKIAVSEGRTKTVVFEFEKENGEQEIKAAQGIKPLSVLTEKDWLKNNGFVEKEEFDSSYLEQRATSKYTFKYAVIKSFPDGLKSIEKTPEKFLVIVVDNSNNSKAAFDKFIKEQEGNMSRFMRKGYDAERDHFNFYKATEKDKRLLESFKVKDRTALIFVNSNGAMLYHTDGTLEDNSNFFQPYYSVYDEVKRADEHLKLDKLFANKKAALTDFKKAFANIVKTKKRFGDIYAPQAIEEDYDETATVEVDSVAMAYEGDDYFQVKDPENLYSIKTARQTIAEKWKLILDSYVKSNVYDEEFILVCKSELINQGFTFKLYGTPKIVNESDFKVLDYLFKNYNEICKKEPNQNVIEDDEYYDYNPGAELSLNATLSNFFQDMTSESASLHRSNQIKLIGYYKTFLQMSGYNFVDFRLYLERIKETNRNDNALYYKEFDEFFQNVNSRNTSLLETLDEMYESQKKHADNWVNFKNSFSQLANNVAWEVVETKNSDSATIQKAVKWSEASLKVTKAEHNYLDTLAQLYYKNNEKEKGIKFEQQAIDVVRNSDEKRAKEYSDILDKMKNGTY